MYSPYPTMLQLYQKFFIISLNLCTCSHASIILKGLRHQYISLTRRIMPQGSNTVLSNIFCFEFGHTLIIQSQETNSLSILLSNDSQSLYQVHLLPIGSSISSFSMNLLNSIISFSCSSLAQTTFSSGFLTVLMSPPQTPI